MKKTNGLQDDMPSNLESSKVEQAIKCLKEAGYLMIFWSRQEIEQRFISLGIKCTPERIKFIANQLQRQYNPQLGISYDTIDYEIEDTIFEEHGI